MFDFIRRLFSSDGFMPHGHCYLWDPRVLWLHLISDAFVALAYTTIPFTLLYLVRKRKDTPFNWMMLCFGVFIIACGTTHVMEIWTLWTPTYWLAGVIKAITAVASVATAILLIRLVPQALAIPTVKELEVAHAELRTAHARLESESRDLRLREEELRRAKELAESASRELEAFSYSVAHDLRAPLRSINGFSAALVEDLGDKCDDQAKRHLERIGQASTRMAELIDALLRLSKVSRAGTTRGTIDITQVANEVVAQLRVVPGAVETDCIVAEGLVAQGDPPLVRQLLENLLGNAWKFAARQPRPRVEVGRDGDGFFVRDNGAGFDMAYANKLFEPFQRLHTDYAGTGIGLATVQRIVKRHEGRVWAEGKVDQGATFHFTLEADQQPGKQAVPSA